jgi:hypothetical protein
VHNESRVKQPGGKAAKAMRGSEEQQGRPELKELVREASAALARLDAERLEELARCCQALNRGLRRRVGTDGGVQKNRIELARQSREAAGEFVVFTRVLEATRANLDVMMRLRASLEEELEYGGQTRARHWARPEANDGNN